MSKNAKSNVALLKAYRWTDSLVYLRHSAEHGPMC